MALNKTLKEEANEELDDESIKRTRKETAYPKDFAPCPGVQGLVPRRVRFPGRHHLQDDITCKRPREEAYACRSSWENSFPTELPGMGGAELRRVQVARKRRHSHSTDPVRIFLIDLIGRN